MNHASVKAFLTQFCDQLPDVEFMDIELKPEQYLHFLLPEQTRFGIALLQDPEHIVCCITCFNSNGQLVKMGDCPEQQPDWFKADYYLASGFRTDWGLNQNKPSGFMPWLTQILTQVAQN